ncbi:MAG: hypothetical protein AABZ94_01925 [Candidatus Eisenbacteria bacterium]
MNPHAIARFLVTVTILCGTAAAEAAPYRLEDGTGSAYPADTPRDADSPQPGPRIEWSATYASRYSFQGLDYSEGRPVLQPQVTCGLNRFSLSVWGNLDQTRGELNEVDGTVQRDWGRGPLSGALGYVYLDYPNRPDWKSSQEVFADLSLDAPLQPSVSVHWDVDQGRGRYWAFGLGHELSGSKASLGLTSKLYVHEHYYQMTGISGLETGVGVTAAWGRFALQPSLTRLWSWENRDFRDAEATKPGWVLSLTVSPR